MPFLTLSRAHFHEIFGIDNDQDEMGRVRERKRQKEQEEAAAANINFTVVWIREWGWGWMIKGSETTEKAWKMFLYLCLFTHEFTI
jgi:hypothetical protein